MDGRAEQVILHLSLIPSIGASVIHAILQKISPNNLAAIYSFTPVDWQQFGFSQKIIDALIEGLRDTQALERELACLKKINADIITWLDGEYPDQLRHIHLPPPVLYYRGAKELLTVSAKRLAVVGSRNASAYAQRALNALLPSVIEQGVIIVSGGARGVDSMAHSVALHVSAPTIAVVGSGFLHPYPREHIKLFEAIVASGGLLLSPFGLDEQPLPGNFPARNRIVSGISDGCFIVQAARKSGAKITAQFAREQGKELFVLPGQFDDPLSEGCHELLKEGAELVSSSQTFLDAFGLGSLSGSLTSLPHSFTSLSVLSNALAVGSVNRSAVKEIAEPLSECDPKKQIVASCKEPRDIDELSTLLNIEFFELQQLLLTLQIEGALEQNMIGQWTAIK